MAVHAQSSTSAPIQQWPSNVAMHEQARVLTDIYQPDINIAVWQRTFAVPLTCAIDQFLLAHPTFHFAREVSVAETKSCLIKRFGESPAVAMLADNIAELVDMFACLFEREQVGLRLAAVDRATCPRFHVDKVACRLVTTYRGAGTQWLPNEATDRSKLGAGHQGKSDEESGLIPSGNHIQCLNPADVALLKGEHWLGNENRGVIHRSPAVVGQAPRLLLTLDLVD